jgi:hypothetical protein
MHTANPRWKRICRVLVRPQCEIEVFTCTNGRIVHVISHNSLSLALTSRHIKQSMRWTGLSFSILLETL